MQRQHVLRPRATRRLERLSVPLLLGGALIVGACSSAEGGTADTSGAATTAPPAPTVDDPPSVTTVSVPDEPSESTASTASTEPTEPTSPTIDEEPAPDPIELVFAELDAMGFTGTVMAQSPNGAWSAGFGLADRAASVANDVDTVFDIGSLTKQFTAAAILRLQMDGRLSVDDPVGDHVDGLRPDQAALTLHQLLTHTAGVPHGLGPDDEVIALDDYIARVADTAGASTPIGQFAYSNVGYSLLGAVVEAVSGASYESYLHEALFEPAGMTQTGYVLPDWTDATIAVGYDGIAVFGRPNEQPWDVDGPGWNLRANGGLLSTMPDLLRWDAALRGDDVLDAAAKQQLFAPHVPLDDEGDAYYGYGWTIVPLADGTALIQHNGGNGVFFADFWRLTDHDATIVLASNVADSVAFEVGDALAGELLGPDVFGDDGGACELETLSTVAVSEFETIADDPDTPAGRAFAAWIDVLLADPSAEADTESTLREYVARSVGPGFIEELGLDTVVAFVQELQDELDGFDVQRMHRQDESTFHVVVAGADGQNAVISARIGDAPEWHIDCVGLPG